VTALDELELLAERGIGVELRSHPPSRWFCRVWYDADLWDGAASAWEATGDTPLSALRAALEKMESA
jgi:hypothetical protein